MILYHLYQDREIGKAVGGKKFTEHEVPEYKGKKCLQCKGRFNIKSKYVPGLQAMWSTSTCEQ